MRDSTDAHFIAGQKILARKPVLMPIATLVRAMNERWDGTGTPDGLRGSAIPLPSRIVAVCEAYDSLTNPADHTEPMSAAEAIDELVHRSGSEFDPGVVEPFRDLVGELEVAAYELATSSSIARSNGRRPRAPSVVRVGVALAGAEPG